jgi:uncharacterized protein
MGLLDRLRFGRSAGVQYSGKRDIYGAAGYTAIGSETFEVFSGIYRRDPIGAAIIDLPVEDTWASPPEIVEEGHPNGTSFTKGLTKLNRSVGIFRALMNADRVAGVGRYSVLLLGLPGDTNRPPLRAGSMSILSYLSVWSEGEAQITRFSQDTHLPAEYKIRAADMSLVTHSQRVIHVPSDATDSLYGRPRLQRCLNVLSDILKISSSTGEAYWQSVQSILQAKIDPSAEMSADQIEALSADMAAMVHDLRRHLVARGLELSRIEATVPNPSQTIELLFSLVAAASGIPRRRLFGSERGELASTQDESAYLGMIERRRRLYAEPLILRPVLDRLIELGVVPAPKSGDYQVTWAELASPTATEAAEANVKRAQAAKELAGLGGDPLSLVEIDQDRNVWLLPRAAGTPPQPEPDVTVPPGDPEEDLEEDDE